MSTVQEGLLATNVSPEENERLLLPKSDSGETRGYESRFEPSPEGQESLTLTWQYPITGRYLFDGRLTRPTQPIPHR